MLHNERGHHSEKPQHSTESSPRSLQLEKQKRLTESKYILKLGKYGCWELAAEENLHALRVVFPVWKQQKGLF